MKSHHAQSAQAVIEALGSNSEHGLSYAQVTELRNRYGYNQLAGTAPIPLWHKFAGQFKSLVIWILITAAIISGMMREWLDTLVILSIVLLNAILGFLQEEKAGRALAALQRLSAPLARVVRDGVLQSIPARDLVPGDRIELEAGDEIPADARLIEAFGLRTQEAALTGESVPLEKDAHAVLDVDTSLGERQNMVYMGTEVAAGNGFDDRGTLQSCSVSPRRRRKMADAWRPHGRRFGCRGSQGGNRRERSCAADNSRNSI